MNEVADRIRWKLDADAGWRRAIVADPAHALFDAVDAPEVLAECTAYEKALREVLDFCDLMGREGRSSGRFADSICTRIFDNLYISDSPATPAGSQPPEVAGAPLDWRQVAVKLGRLGSDWRLLSTVEAEALRVLVDAAWDRDEAERDVAAERMADAADRGPE